MDTIDAMRTFAAVAAHTSFTGGAKQIGISTKLASKYVARLEERLGAQLLNRTTRSVSLTDTGRAYLDRCLPLLDQFDEMEDAVQARQAELAGPIRITAPTGFGSRELVEALRPFLDAHPKVQMDMRLSDHHVAIVDEGIDLAIRFGVMKNSTLIARKLMDMRSVIIASPAYLEANGTPAHPSELGNHNCLLPLTSREPTVWPFDMHGKTLSVRVHGTFSANSPRSIVHMALGGLGIGRTPHYPARPFLESGNLVTLFDGMQPTPTPLHAVYPPNRHLTARIRALVDHLALWFS